MLRTLAGRPTVRRRGAVLIVVLAMLVLFAVLGIGFLLYAESQNTAARGNNDSEKKDSPPDALLAAEGWSGPFIYGVTDTGDDLLNPIRAHDLARGKYGYQAGVAGYVPYSGTAPLPQENVTFGSGAGAFTLDSRQVVRFTWEQSTGNVFDPERVYGGNAVRNNPANPLPGTYQSKAYGYTYPDRHDFYLAQLDPTTGRITVPSFHRDALGSWDPLAANYFGTQVGGQYKTLRPIPVAGQHPQFPPVPMNPDGSYSGDVQNFRFTAGSQRNDSYWMYAGGPVREWRGKRYAAFVAPLILDLNGRVNLSTAGNVANGPASAQPHASHHGLGGWEVNPMAVGLTAADLATLVQRRHGRTTPVYDAPADPFTQAFSTARLNGGRLPPQHGLFDPSGIPVTDGPLALPAATTFGTTPAYPSRFPATQANLNARLSNHPAQFNPLVYGRGPTTTTPGGFGHDDLIRLLARYSDPKARTTTPTPGLSGLAGNTQTRALVTTFNALQEWGSVPVNTTLNGGTSTRLGPIDLNRPLPDYRTDTTLPLTPLNAGAAQVDAARKARQELARDVFVRLLAATGYFSNNGNPTSLSYYLPTTGYPGYVNDGTNNPTAVPVPANATYNQLRDLAQLAANVVDYLDGDDVSTVFVFNPADPTLAVHPLDDVNNFGADTSDRVVYGTEAPRLALNEVYSSIHNDRTEGNPPGLKATKPYRQQYWIELVNPLPADPTRADVGAARLQYTAASPGYDAVKGAFNPYRVDILKSTPPAPGGTRDYYSQFLGVTGTTQYARAAADPTTVPGLVPYSQINNFADTGGSVLVGDEQFLVHPIGVLGTANANSGYYLLGPKDDHPSNPAGMPPTLVNSTHLTDGGVAPAADALSIALGAGAPTAGPDTTENSTVILRRLANPYLPASTTPGAGYNPYLTVDYVEYIPSRDMLDWANAVGNHGRPDKAKASVGKKHPLAARPYYSQGTGDDAVLDQVAGGVAVAPHTFFAANSNADNNRAAGTLGFEWMVHLDRELVGPAELLHVSGTSPALLGQRFHSSAAPEYHQHTYSANFGASVFRAGLTAAAAPNTFARAYGLLATGGRGPGQPLGGRTAGRVNLNTATAEAVLQAALDPRANNGFTAADVTALWGNVAGSGQPYNRTRGTAPAATDAETAAGTGDRPFVSFAVSTNPDDTFARFDSVTPLGTSLFRAPLAQPHPYTQTETLRKGMNTLSTTSDSFLVLMTVSFFEVTNAGTISVSNPPVFGAELFDKIPGDLRAQFAGVFDRSQLAVTEAGAPADAPVQAKLLADVPTGGNQITVECLPGPAALPAGVTGTAPVAGECALVFDGKAVLVSAATGTRLHLGFGSAAAGTGNGEWVQVLAVTSGGAGSGRATLTLTAGVTNPHGGSEPVSNATFGTPAVLPTGVTLKQLQARGLVPYFTKMEP